MSYAYSLEWEIKARLEMVEVDVIFKGKPCDYKKLKSSQFKKKKNLLHADFYLNMCQYTDNYV